MTGLGLLRDLDGDGWPEILLRMREADRSDRVVVYRPSRSASPP